MSMRVLVTDGMDAGAIETLRRDGHEIVEQFYEPDQLGEALREFDAVIIRSATKIKEPQIDAAKGSRLKLIVRAGVGVDNIAVKYAEAAGITVKNTPRASSNAVAELAIALLFSCARNISIAGHTMREKKWEKKAYSKGFEVMGKTMGVIGYGRIGRMVGEKAQALGMNVLSVVHRNKPEGCECGTMHFVSMDELLAQSDIIVLCAPGGDKPLVDAEVGFPPRRQLHAPCGRGHQGGAEAHRRRAGGHHRAFLIFNQKLSGPNFWTGQFFRKTPEK